MMWKRLIPCVLISALFASHAFAQVPKNPRAPALPMEIELGKFKLFGNTIEAIVEVAEVDATTPPLLNGEVSFGLADMHFEVQLFSEEDKVLGTRTSREFMPHQRVHVRIENRSSIADSSVLDVNLVPHVGLGEGWHYASNIALPPFGTTGNPFTDDYLVTVILFSDNALAVHSDAMPAAALFRGNEGIVIYNAITKLGPTSGGGAGSSPAAGVTTLPAGNVAKQQALVAQFSALKNSLPDFVSASTVYRADTGFGETLESSFQKYEDPSRYAERRGLTTAVLQTAEDIVTNALAQQPIGNDCSVSGVAIPDECTQWIDKGGQRMFYLNLLHEIDGAVEKTRNGVFNAVDGAAHSWDEGWAFWQAITGTAGKREGNCTAAEFGNSVNIDCNLVNSIDAALQAGSSAILGNNGVGLAAPIALLEERLNQVFYLAIFHEVVSMRKKNADLAGFNVARVEGIAFFNTIAYLVPGFDASALEDRNPASFTQAVAQDFMLRLKTAFTGIVRANGLGDPTAIP